MTFWEQALRMVMHAISIVGIDRREAYSRMQRGEPTSTSLATHGA